MTVAERDVVKWFAQRVTPEHRQQVLADLDRASASDERCSAVEFHLEGYTRPRTGIERPLPVNAVAADADGAMVLVSLTQDENGRLYEMQLTRCARGDLLSPDWTTLRELTQEEVTDLGVVDTSEFRIWRWPQAEERPKDS